VRNTAGVIRSIGWPPIHRDGELRVIPGYGSPRIAHSGRTKRDSQIICTSGLSRLVQAYLHKADP
jgi:hypothetical protein